MRIGAVAAVDLDAAAGGDEAEDGIAIDGVAASRQHVVDALQVAVDDQHVVVLRGGLCDVILEDELLSRAGDVVARDGTVALLHLDVLVEHGLRVERALGDVAVEVARLLVAELLDGAHHERLVLVDLAVAEAALQHLLDHEGLLLLRLLEGQTDLRLGAARLDNLQPLLLGALGGRRHDLDLVAGAQLLAEGDQLVVDARARAGRPHLRVDIVSHVEHRGPLGESHQVALGREDVDLVLLQLADEVVHRLETAVGMLQHLADAGQPLVHAALSLTDALIAPVGCDAALCYLVHALRAYLHLDPLVLRAQDGDVEALVAVRLGHREPVAHALGVRGVHVGDECEGLPAAHLLLLRRAVDDDADGKEVVDALKLAVLLLHLLPDGVD